MLAAGSPPASASRRRAKCGGRNRALLFIGYAFSWCSPSRPVGVVAGGSNALRVTSFSRSPSSRPRCAGRFDAELATADSGEQSLQIMVDAVRALFLVYAGRKRRVGSGGWGQSPSSLSSALSRSGANQRASPVNSLRLVGRDGTRGARDCRLWLPPQTGEGPGGALFVATGDGLAHALEAGRYGPSASRRCGGGAAVALTTESPRR